MVYFSVLLKNRNLTMVLKHNLSPLTSLVFSIYNIIYMYTHPFVYILKNFLFLLLTCYASSVLLLEPDNKLCSEFHAVIVEKIKQGLLLKPIPLCHELQIVKYS